MNNEVEDLLPKFEDAKVSYNFENQKALEFD